MIPHMKVQKGRPHILGYFVRGVPNILGYLAPPVQNIMHTYILEWLLKLCELIEALFHYTGGPLVHLVVLVGRCSQHTFYRLNM